MQRCSEADAVEQARTGMTDLMNLERFCLAGYGSHRPKRDRPGHEPARTAVVDRLSEALLNCDRTDKLGIYAVDSCNS